MAVPIRRQPRDLIARLGSKSPKRVAMVITAGRQRQRGDRATNADCRGNAQSLEVGRSGKAQTQHRAGDGQARPQDHVRGSAVHAVESGFAVLAGLRASW